MSQDTLGPMDDALAQRIEKMFAERMKVAGIKPMTKRYMDAQAHFFSGAMTATMSGPPLWVISILTGRSISAERKRIAQTAEQKQ